MWNRDITAAEMIGRELHICPWPGCDGRLKQTTHNYRGGITRTYPNEYLLASGKMPEHWGNRRYA